MPVDKPLPRRRLMSERDSDSMSVRKAPAASHQFKYLLAEHLPLLSRFASNDWSAYHLGEGRCQTGCLVPWKEAPRPKREAASYQGIAVTSALNQGFRSNEEMREIPQFMANPTARSAWYLGDDRLQLCRGSNFGPWIGNLRRSCPT